MRTSVCGPTPKTGDVVSSGWCGLPSKDGLVQWSVVVVLSHWGLYELSTATWHTRKAFFIIDRQISSGHTCATTLPLEECEPLLSLICSRMPCPSSAAVQGVAVSLVSGISGGILELECPQLLARSYVAVLGLELFEQLHLLLAVLVLIPMLARVRVRESGCVCVCVRAALHACARVYA